MPQSTLARAKNAAARAAFGGADYFYEKTGAGRPRGRPPKPVFAAARYESRYASAALQPSRPDAFKSYAV